jgi:glutamyl-tRNA synthetase
LRQRLGALEDFGKEALHRCVHAYVEENGLKFKAVGPALRAALLGTAGGPELSDIMAVVGRQDTLARLDRALALL